MLELSGIPVPKVMVGQSLAPRLLVGEPVIGREDVFAYHDPGHLMIRGESHKYLRFAKNDPDPDSNFEKTTNNELWAKRNKVDILDF